MTAPRETFWSWARIFVVLGTFFTVFANLRLSAVYFTLSDALLMLGAGFMLFGSGLAIRPFGSATSAWMFFVALLLGSLLLSSMLTGALDRWLVVSMQYAFSFVLLPMVLLANNERAWRLYAMAFVVGLICMEIFAFGVITYFDGSYPAISKIFGYDFYSGMGRIGGFVGNPNRHAALISMSLPFLYYFRMTGLISTPKFLIGLGILAAALVYTASATGIATALLVSLAFLIVSRVRLPRTAIAVMAAAMAVPFVAEVPLPEVFKERVGDAVSTGNIEEVGTFRGRAELIQEAWDIADNTMILGLGVDQYRVFSPSGKPVHHSGLLLWTEGGLLALIAWIGVIAILFISGLSVFTQRPHDAALAIATILAFFVFSNTTTHMYARLWMVPVLLSLGPSLLNNFAHAMPTKAKWPPPKVSSFAENRLRSN